LSGRRRSSGRSAVIAAADGLCETGRLSRNDRRPSANKRRLSKANTMVQETGNHVHHDQRSAISRSHSAGGSERAGSSKVNRNINRFSNFVKSGMEAYVLGESRMNGQSGEKHEIIISGPLVQWRPIQQYYTCTVDKPKKETKLKGLKSFIAYSLTSSLSRIQVSRRYKHFDWLHDQLSAKYIMIAIPPLPEKQVSGRYEDDLIDHRKHILQLWVNKICRHPVLSQSEVWLHFITCTDEKEWKNGKRKAEKIAIDNYSERQVDKFQRSVKTSEDAMRVMQERLGVFQKLFIGPVKSNWQKMALAFVTLAQSFHTDDHPGSNRMVDALKQTAHHYHQIGEDFEAHSKNDMEPVMESLYSFKGTIQTAPDILHVHKQAIQKYRECEGKLSHADAERIKRRVDSTSYAVLAEMNHLNTEKIEDVRVTMYNYLKRQAEFYQKMANSLNDMAKLYEF
ncbi:PX domain protein, partial [Ancylostoma caninum]